MLALHFASCEVMFCRLCYELSLPYSEIAKEMSLPLLSVLELEESMLRGLRSFRPKPKYPVDILTYAGDFAIPEKSISKMIVGLIQIVALDLSNSAEYSKAIPRQVNPRTSARINLNEQDARLWLEEKNSDRIFSREVCQAYLERKGVVFSAIMESIVNDPRQTLVKLTERTGIGVLNETEKKLIAEDRKIGRKINKKSRLLEIINAVKNGSEYNLELPFDVFWQRMCDAASKVALAQGIKNLEQERHWPDVTKSANTTIYDLIRENGGKLPELQDLTNISFPRRTQRRRRLVREDKPGSTQTMQKKKKRMSNTPS